MKKYLLIPALLLAGVNVFAQSAEKIQWLTLEEALSKSAVAPKKIMIDVYTDWCGWCKKMDKSTFTDSTVAGYINRNFYPVKLNAETKDTILYKDKKYTFVPQYKANEIAAVFLNGNMGYPTIVYLDEKADLIGPVPGYLSAEQMKPVMEYFGNDLYKTVKWDDYVKANYK